MASITITLPESFSIESRKKSVSINPSALSADIVAKLVLHGLTQKISDSAASATKEAIVTVSGDDKADANTYKAMTDADKAKVVSLAADIGLGWMEETATNLINGIWGATRVAGSGANPMQSALRNVCRSVLFPKDANGKALKSRFDAKNLEAWKAADPKERNAMLDAIIAKQSEATLATWTAQAEADIAAAKAAAEKAAKLADKLADDFTI